MSKEQFDERLEIRQREREHYEMVRRLVISGADTIEFEERRADASWRETWVRDKREAKPEIGCLNADIWYLLGPIGVYGHCAGALPWHPPGSNE